jgi:hypothetical protein
MRHVANGLVEPGELDDAVACEQNTRRKRTSDKIYSRPLKSQKHL